MTRCSHFFSCSFSFYSSFSHQQEDDFNLPKKKIGFVFYQKNCVLLLKGVFIYIFEATTTKNKYKI